MSSINTATNGNLVVISLATTDLFPKLSVVPERVSLPPLASSFSGGKATTQHSVARSSKAAMTRYGSPDSNTHGALNRVRVSENHLAVAVSPLGPSS